MLVDKVEETAYGPDITKEVAVRKLRLKMHERPQLEKCNTLKVLLELSQTGPEKQLFSMYCEAVISGIDLRQVSAYDFEFTVLQESSLVHQYGSLWEAKLLNLPASSRSPSALTAAMLNSLGQPALLPQYWLDWTYDPKAPSHSLPRPTLDMPTRIDFFAFRNGKRMAIEVDGPEHYANFDRQNGKYVLSEEVYAKNLRIDRSMRFQGWKIHRVSNWEVNAQPNRALADLADALELPLEGWGVEPLLPGLPDIRDLPF
ncbi:MAG: hypothetical protein HYU30_07235 [Chloroflexi bacterium]|nr:hypothetical protein [Chloroflexota bacterium]